MKSSLIRALLATSMIGAVSVPASAAVVTEDWTFTSTNSTGAGQITLNTNTGVVTGFTGQYNGAVLTFIDPSSLNSNGDGTYTYHGVPNTGGADYTVDYLYPLTVSGFLVSTGSGSGQVVYDLSLDSPGAGFQDFFSIDSQGNYHADNGIFSAVPEPSTWAMLMIGFVGLGMMYGRARKNSGMSAIA